MSYNRTHAWIAIISLNGLTIAVLSTFARNPIDGLWQNVYTSYYLVWIAILGVIVIVVVPSSKSPFSWSIFIFILIYVIFCSSVFSMLLGVPYPIHDPWVHISYARFNILNIVKNPYPTYHIFILIINQVAGLGITHWITVTGTLMIILAAVLLTSLVRAVPGLDEFKQPAIFAVLPGLMLGFIPRPFTFAWSLAPLMFWLFYQLWITNNKWPFRIIVIVFGLISPILHPQFSLLLLSMSLSYLIISILSRYWPRSPITENVDLIHGFSIFAFIGLATITHIILLTKTGESILEAAISRFISGATTGSTNGGGVTPGSAGGVGVGLFSDILSSRSEAVEAITRLSYIIPLTLLSIIQIIKNNWSKNTNFLSTYTILTFVLMSGSFFVVWGFTSSLGLERVVLVSSVLLIPIVFCTYDRSPNSLVIILILVCVATGLVTIYPSGFTGSAGLSSNQKMADGAQWVVEYNDGQQIIHSQASEWMMQAYTPIKNLLPLRYKPSNNASYTFRWGIKGADGLYVYDDVTNASINRYAYENPGEKSIRPKYHRLKEERNKIYSNKGSQVFSN